MRDKRPNIANQLVRESLTEALFQLMQEESFEKISIATLVEKAGVARSSFYRNYQRKEEIISDFLIEYLIGKFDTAYEEKDMHHFWQFYFESFKGISDLLTLMGKADLMWLLFSKIIEMLMLDNFNVAQLGKTSHLTNSAVAGLLTGILIEWVNNDFTESPAELATLLMTLNLNEEEENNERTTDHVRTRFE